MLGINFKLSNMTIILRGESVPGPDISTLFSIDLYTGNGTSQSITSNLDMSAGTGFVWIRHRNSANNHVLCDTLRGALEVIRSNDNTAEATLSGSLTSFNADGYSVGSQGQVNLNLGTYVGWSFLEAAKFHGVITYTGDGIAGRTVAHSLGVAPGLVLVKRLDTAADWAVQHISRGGTKYLVFNENAAEVANINRWDDTAADASNVTLGTDATVNLNTATYVMYVFAHDPAGNGVIKCGQYTGNGSSSGPSINLSWKPQYIMIKRADAGTSSWVVIDTTRGILSPGTDKRLFPNVTSAEVATDIVSLTATGFDITTSDVAVNNSGDDYVFMAIREE